MERHCGQRRIYLSWLFSSPIPVSLLTLLGRGFIYVDGLVVESFLSSVLSIVFSSYTDAHISTTHIRKSVWQIPVRTTWYTYSTAITGTEVNS